MTIGILALQGGYEAHARLLRRLRTPYTYIKQAHELSSVDALIIPGGESTTLLSFLDDPFLKAIQHLVTLEHRPLLGTCAGAILMANQLIGAEQRSLGLLDISIERNAYG